ncbi:MAG: FprA family A-type flavoprotein [Bacteroidales bacterium]
MINISNKVFYLGINDRKTTLFENNWPLPYGISYNSYLIADEKTALIDTLEYGSDPLYKKNIAKLLGDKKLNYLVINHMEPDHSSMIGEIIEKYPNVKVVGNNQTKKLLDIYYPLPEESFLKVSNGQELKLGHHNLKFVLTPWVHWPETMMTYDTTDQMLFSGDAFGTYGTLDGTIYDDQVDLKFFEEEGRRYYSNIVGKWSIMVQNAFKKLVDIPLKFICPAHGPIWRKDPTQVIEWYNKWSLHKAEDGVVIAYASMYGNTEKLADTIALKLAEKGIRNIHIYDVSKTHISFILSDIWKYKGLILGSCAYNSDMHPMMAALIHELSVSSPKNKVVSVFGGSSWNGAGAKSILAACQQMKMNVSEDILELSGVFESNKVDTTAFVKDMVSRLNK